MTQAETKAQETPTPSRSPGRASTSLAKAAGIYHDALTEAKKALEYSQHALDCVVALDDEDEGKDGGSATCQDCVKINKRAISLINQALASFARAQP